MGLQWPLLLLEQHISFTVDGLGGEAGSGRLPGVLPGLCASLSLQQKGHENSSHCTYILGNLISHVLAELGLLQLLLVVLALLLVGVTLHEHVMLLHVLVVTIILPLEVVFVAR